MIGGAKGIGLGIDLGLVNQYNRTGSQSYIEPEVLDSLVGVWSAYGMTNDSPNRSTIKNKLSNKGGDFVISNAAYDKMSSYGGYEFAKFDNTLDWYNTEGNDSVVVVSRNGHSITLKRLTGPNFWYFQNSTFRGLISNVIPFKVNSNKNISVIWDVHGLSISEGKDKSVRVQELVLNPNEDNYTNLKTLNEEELAQIDISTNSLYYLLWFDLSTLAVDEEVTIEMLPLFEGAFVTDGIDDLITSTKTVQEMLGGSNEITVVSMIHQVKDSSNNVSFTNYIRGSANGYFRNIVNNYDKTGIYGYTSSDLKALSVVNNILGDKNDYTSNGDNRDSIINGNFSVQGYSYNDGNNTGDFSSVAWYWTIIANKVLTTDQINQVIAYFNLDRTLKSDIYCNIAKQGITNENHAEFGDKLIDFSGNGRDIQLNNIAWDGDSGIGKYNYPNWKVTATIANTYSTIVNYPTVNGTYSINVNGVSELMQSIGLHLEIKYTTSTGIIYNDIKQDGVYSYILPDGATDLTLRFGGIPGIVNEPCNITITQIPSHAGALCLDGVNDFGQFVGDLELKDYTFIADRAYSRIAPSQVPFIASTQTNGQAPFLMEYLNEDTYVYPHSFGTTTKTINLNIQRQISYQSTYVYNGNSISKGISVDTGDGLTIGNSGSTGAQYSPLCLWSLMLFPYSMSEFLIERQLKKHKLGTLYPDMVEFRPVINSNVLLDSKPTFVIRGTSTHLNAGDYVPENSQIWVSIKMNNIADRITKFTVNGKTIDIPENAYSEVTLQYGFPFVIDKSPQKIGITIEQDENYVLFNPVITSNVEYHRLDFYLNNYQKIINIGDYIPKDAYLRANIYLNNNVDELTAFIFNGVNIGYRRSSVDDTAFNISHIYNYDSPQEVNITIDEYIRYEDIVQPYPVLLRFNDENGNEVSWGGKFRVGSTITIIGSAADSNLLPNIYNIFGLLLNDNQVTSSKVIVEKTMVFKAKSAYIFDNNEPNCILSPRLLRIPNSSYKILGYIPDISGHGNHGVIHNSAYAEGSGVNEDGSYQFDGVDDFITIPTTVGGKQVLMKVNWQSIAGTAILYDQRTNGGFAIFNRDFDTNENKVPAYRARNIGGSTYIDGILNEYIYASELKDITHNIVELCDPELNTGTLNPKIGSSFLNSNYTQMSLYDFMLFDEISTDDKIKELNEYVGIEAKVELPPYYWDTYGKTNLDVDRGIVPQLGIAKDYSFASFDNEMAWYLIPNDNYINVVSRNGYEITLKNLSTGVNGWRFQNSTVKGFISHDIPFRIKANKSIRVYWDMHYYKVSTGAEFGEVISITNVSPNKDTYINLRHLTEEELAKLDTNKDRMYYLLWFDLSTIAVNEEVVIEMLPVEGGRNLWLNNYNFAYDKMSGFGGYNLSRFNKSWSSSSNTSVIVVSRNPYDITLKKLGGNSDWEFNNTELKVISNPVSVKFKSNKNIRVTCDYHYYPVGGNSEGTPLGITSKDLIANKDAIITISPISQENIDKYNIDVNRGYYLIYFQLSSTLAVNEEVTIEMLPLYPNGLVYDGVTDYSENANIPMFDDFTFLVKASLPNGFIGSGGAIAKKGSNTQVIGGGYDFVYALDSNTSKANKNSYWSFGKALLVSTGAIDPPLIGYMTKTNVNGIPTTAGTNPSIKGITFSKWSGYISMIFYKAILYPKTIPLLQINFLKNLMERDEIIDLDNPIFKK